MRSVTMYYSAILAASAGLASAAATCTSDILITTPTPTIDCDVVDANIRVAETVAGDLLIDGPKQLTGDLIIANASQLYSVSSPTINNIEGNFDLENLELLGSLSMSSLTTVTKLTLQKLNQLSSMKFGPDGIAKAKSVSITDTFIDDLSSLNLVTVDTITLSNNFKLTKFNSNLVNITTSFIATNNGADFEISMPKLAVAGEIQLSNVKSFSVPALEKVTASIKFDKNSGLQQFEARNLSTVTDSVTFINNNNLANISFPQLTKVGDLTILNNTALNEINGFPKLDTVSGGILMGGSFKSVELPSLKDVKGGSTVTSSTDIDSSCAFFNDAKKRGSIQGSEKCTSNNTKANEGGDGGSSGHASTSKPSNPNSAIGSASRQMGLALGLALLAGITQLL